MLLSRWWKRNTEPTFEELKKTILNEIFDVYIPQEQCQNVQHNKSFKQYYCKNDEDKKLMCIECFQEHKLECEVDNCIQNIKQYQRQQMKKFSSLCKRIEETKAQNHQFAIISTTEIIQTRSKMFDLFEQILKGAERVNQGIPLEFSKIQQESRELLYNCFNNILQHKISVTDVQYEGKEYLKQIEELILKERGEKEEFGVRKQEEFRNLLMEIVRKMVGVISGMAGIKEDTKTETESRSNVSVKQKEKEREKEQVKSESESQEEKESSEQQESDSEDEKQQPKTHQQSQNHDAKQPQQINNTKVLQFQQWQQNVKLQNYISTQSQQLKQARSQIDRLTQQNYKLNNSLSLLTNQLNNQKSTNQILEFKLYNLDSELISRNDQIAKFSQELSDLKEESQNDLNIIVKELELESLQKNKYYEMYLDRSSQLKDRKMELDKLTDYIEQLKQYYENKRKGHKTQLLASKNYQTKLESQFLQLQEAYNQTTKQLQTSLRNINMFEELNKELKYRLTEVESPLRKSVSSTLLNYTAQEKPHKPQGDIQSRLISKFQKFWIAEIIEQYLSRSVQFRNISSFEDENNNHQNIDVAQSIEGCDVYLTIVKVKEDCVIGWLTSKKLNQNQLFFNATKRKTFQWNRAGLVNQKIIGLQGDKGFQISGKEIKTKNGNLLNKALEAKGTGNVVEIMKYEIIEVI